MATETTPIRSFRDEMTEDEKKDFFALAEFLNEDICIQQQKMSTDALELFVNELLQPGYAASESVEKASTTKQMLQVCVREGLLSKNDLRQLAKRQWLGDYFTAKVAMMLENAMDYSKTWDKEKRENQGDKKKRRKPGYTESKELPWLSHFHLNVSISTIQNVCTTYGVVAALLLTMNMASFGSMNIEEWETFKRISAVDRCTNGEIFLDKSNGTDSCAERLTDVTEAWFVVSNSFASFLLLICVVFSSGIYISIGYPNVQGSRPDEEQGVVARFSGEFATLNVLFILSTLASGVGLTQFLQLKIRSWQLVLVVMWLGIVAAFILIMVIVWLALEIQVANNVIEHLRNNNATRRKNPLDLPETAAKVVKKLLAKACCCRTSNKVQP